MMDESAAALYNYLMVGGLLFAIGTIGFLVRPSTAAKAAQRIERDSKL